MCIRDRTEAIGTGPYKMQQFTVGQQTVLVRNDDYKSASALSKNQGPAKFKKLTFREIGEESTAYLELKTGGADVLVNVPTDFLPRIQADKAVKLVTIPGNEVVYMPINTSVEPFTDIKAVSYTHLDLARTLRLRLHALVGTLEARHQPLDLLDDLRELAADLLHLLHAAADLLGELVHAHDAGRDGRLDVLDHLLDVVGRDGGLVGKAADLGRDHGEAAAILPGLLRFDRGVEREQVGLVGDLGDGGDDLVDVCLLYTSRCV